MVKSGARSRKRSARFTFFNHRSFESRLLAAHRSIICATSTGLTFTFLGHTYSPGEPVMATPLG
jgi:hypothetical protein